MPIKWKRMQYRQQLLIYGSLPLAYVMHASEIIFTIVPIHVARTCTSTHTHTQAHRHIHAYTHTHTHMHTHMHVHTYAHMYVS